ncbi:uncharacterized protein LOC124418634 [Lucilia cuprina]|uniref:uncharacterized protein LOC124418634 n=1 Tax=Lucilia cuprina TaxID=7375 RepID=UPI001F059C9A|nr:uncharacterized protein LOC124418634 [Lucilia cuprina]
MVRFRRYRTSRPHINQCSQIDLILGNDSERYINIDGIKKNVCDPTNTIFGWVLSGPIIGNPIHSLTTTIVPSETSILNDLLRKFREQEELPSPKHLSKEDQYCEQFYKETTIRQADGRYVERLPFKKEFPNFIFLGASRILALGQYSRIKQSLAKSPNLQAQYNAVLEEYLSLQHMEKSSFREISSDNKYFSFYLPHHAVVRPEHKTTKVWVVFNASRITKSGYSLNDVLYTGQTLQQDLMNVILNWRKYRYVFRGDIQKMYRQILVHLEDRPFQRILFQKEHNAPFIDYKLKTVTLKNNFLKQPLFYAMKLTLTIYYLVVIQ